MLIEIAGDGTAIQERQDKMEKYKCESCEWAMESLVVSKCISDVKVLMSVLCDI